MPWRSLFPANTTVCPLAHPDIYLEIGDGAVKVRDQGVVYTEREHQGDDVERTRKGPATASAAVTQRGFFWEGFVVDEIVPGDAEAARYHALSTDSVGLVSYRMYCLLVVESRPLCERGKKQKTRGLLCFGGTRSREALDGAVAMSHDDGAPREQPALPFLTEPVLQSVEVAEPIKIALVREVVLVRDVGLKK